jgi:hypothetical protein
MAPGITSQDHRIRNAEQEHTLRHYAAQASMIGDEGTAIRGSS